jgi:ABC-2 type transport system ATP-binding protein
LLRAENLTKKYGDHIAADNISFEIKAGELVGLLGLNGAGKTTTLNMLTGFLAPTGGKVYIDESDLSKEPLKAARHIGFLPDTPPVYNEMTVRDYLSFVFDLKGVKAYYKQPERLDDFKFTKLEKNIERFFDTLVPLPKSVLYKQYKPHHIVEACKQTDILDVTGRLIGNLSRGYKQRVGLAAALIGDPDILILDEPTVGLDPKQIKDIRLLIAELAKSRTVILSTHILSEVEAICDRVLVLNNGKLAADLKLPLEAGKSLEDMFMSLIVRAVK